METETVSQPDVDVVVIGAGFSGVRMLAELQKLGLSAKCFESGSDVGGTWYWNRFPGAQTDTESWVYCYDFDNGLMEDWDWPERFPKQEQTLAYIQHVADRFDLRRHIMFNTKVRSAEWSDERHIWTFTTEAGVTCTARYYCSATGLLSQPIEPSFPGLDTFQGDCHMSARWPHGEVDLEGKRVAVVGTGSTGVGIIPTIVEQVGHLKVFQRTANYVLPGRNYVTTAEKREAVKRNYEAVWQEAYAHPMGMWFKPANRVSADVPDPAERQRIFEQGWEAGSFRFLSETFDDIIVDQNLNDEASDFLRHKIRMLVDDPETAELLCPDHSFAVKRPPTGHFYYEAFNRPNVELVSVKHNPIIEIVPNGIKLADGSIHEVDAIIFAMGFDAVTGAVTSIDVKGLGQRTIKEAWFDNQPAQYLGLSGADFPNMFTIAGPQGGFGNHCASMNQQVRWIGSILTYARDNEYTRVVAEPEAAESWAQECETIANATLLPQGIAAGSWFFGANVEGGKPRVIFYFGGVHNYADKLSETATNEYPGFAFV